MTLNLSIPDQDELKPRITVFGVGGAGGNAVNNMIENKLEGVEFVVANTDAQALQQNKAPSKIQLGTKVTEGLGAGAKPQIGAAAAEESIEQIVDQLAGSHMCFITAGMGGGTGTGAAPIIAQAARELGVLTVGVVTKPFQFEGAKRMRQAEAGVETLQEVVDTLIIIPNQNLFRMANEKTTFTEAFAMADDVLYQGVKGVTDLMVCPGLINLDFADVRAVMDEMGKAMMGTGEAEGEDRAIQAAEKAIANPLLDELSLRGAKGVLINITGSNDLTLFELDEAANRIREEVDPEANIIVGSTLDTTMDGKMRVSVVATGIDASAKAEPAANAANRQAKPEPASRSEGPGDIYAEFSGAAQAPVSTPDVPAFDPAMSREPAQPAMKPEPVSAADDLPPPAYQPRAEHRHPEPQMEMAHAPEYAHHQQPADTGAMHQAYPGSSEQVAYRSAEPIQHHAKPAGAGRRSTFSSIISRMTGNAAEPQPAPVQRPAPVQETMHPSEMRRPAPIPQPAVHHQAPIHAPVDEDQEKIEIPAFLRRQTN